MHHAFVLAHSEFNVELSRARDGYRLHIGDRVLPINLHREDDGSHVLTVAGHSQRVLLAVSGDDIFIHLDGAAYHLRYRHPLDRLAAQLHGSAEDIVQAPMPGCIVAIHVNAGDAVSRGQTLLVMESMKMETTIASPRDGVVEAIHFQQGQSFDRDALLVILTAETPS